MALTMCTLDNTPVTDFTSLHRISICQFIKGEENVTETSKRLGQCRRPRL